MAKPVATISIGKAGNHKRKIELWDEFLLVKYDQYHHEIPLEEIRTLSVEHSYHRWLIIIGGFLASISLLLIFGDYYSLPLLLLLLLFVSVFTLYVGIRGNYYFMIHQASGTKLHFPVGINDHKIKAFVSFANQYMG